MKELLDIHGFKDTRVIQDLTGKDRVVCGTGQRPQAYEEVYICLTVWMICFGITKS